MTETTHGGKREGSGRPAGTANVSPGLRTQFREHTETAVSAIVAIAGNPDHQHHLKACELILSRGYGAVPAQPNDAEEIIKQFTDGDISAITAGLLIEAKGLKVGDLMQNYIKHEFEVDLASRPFTTEPEKLPIC